MKTACELRLAFFASLAIPVTLLAGDAMPFSVSLKPGEMHEECVRLEAGQKRDYSWKSDAPLDFNIHYHEANKVSYPVKRAAMRGDGGTFIAKIGQDYCWMWSARDKAAKLDGKIK